MDSLSDDESEGSESEEEGEQSEAEQSESEDESNSGPVIVELISVEDFMKDPNDSNLMALGNKRAEYLLQEATVSH